VRDDENVGDEGTEGTQLEIFAKSDQVVAPRQMSLAIKNKHSLMHSAFPELVSPRNVRLQEESDSAAQRLKRTSSNLVLRGNKQKGSKQLQQPPKKVNMGSENESEEDSDIDINVAFQEHVLRKPGVPFVDKQEKRKNKNDDSYMEEPADRSPEARDLFSPKFGGDEVEN